MTMENAPESFGRFLKSLRLQQGLDLEEISNRTHVSRDCLILLEREDHEKLPAPIYVKGFIRAYAEVLRVDAADILSRYHEDLRKKNAQTKEADHLKSRFGFWSRQFIAVGALMMVIFISVTSVRYLGERAVRVDNNPPPEVMMNMNSPVQKSDETAAGIHPAPATKPEKLILRVIAIESTWFKAIIDGRAPLEFNLKPQDQLEFEANAHFNLLVGNAAGVQLLLNDKPVQVNGGHGEMVTVQLP